MASIKEIRTRIKSVDQTLKITNAMYLISSSKMRKARQQLNGVEPYFQKIQDTIADILYHSEEFRHPFMDTRPGKKKRTVGYIVITGDKGLAGAYNHNVLKLAEEKLAATENPVLFVIGQVGRAYFSGKNVNVDGEFLYTAQDPTVTRARDISDTMVDLFLRGQLDEVHVLDIIDCNAGDHGQPFATNFNPEINIREVTARGRYWERGEWVETDPLSWSMTYDFPDGIGPKKCFLMYHEELESLVQNLKGLKRARFWMTFSENYLNHLKVLGNVGMTRIDPVRFQGQDIVPIQFLRALLPDPASLGPLTKGKTCIGNVMRGIKDGKEKTVYIYNICDHEACYAEVGSQAISYTTGVPAMIGAKMMVSGQWLKPGVWNMEQFDPDPFMADLNAYGLPWQCVEVKD